MSKKQTIEQRAADIAASVNLPAAAASDSTTTTAAKSKLGAGLLARNSLYGVDPRTISRREGWNPRFDFGEIAELAKSIKANGVLNPIRVKRVAPFVKDENVGPSGGQVFCFELIDGDRRLTAVELLLKEGHEFPEGIPAVVVDKNQEDITSLVQMFEANTGKAFLPIEEAAAYKRLVDAGLSVAEVAKRIGKDATHIREMMVLLEADKSVQDAVTSGAIGKTVAKRIANEVKGDKKKQAELVAAATAAAKTAKGKGGDKKVAAELDAARRSRQQDRAKKGKAVKMRALSDAELSAIGSKLSQHMVDKMTEAGKPLDFDVREWIAKDDNLALAFTYGALEALKAAAGMVVELNI